MKKLKVLSGVVAAGLLFAMMPRIGSFDWDYWKKRAIVVGSAIITAGVVDRVLEYFRIF